MGRDWGPWIDHDGMGQPHLVGVYLNVVGVFAVSGSKAMAGEEWQQYGLCRSTDHPAWDCSNYGRIIEGQSCGKVLRYRVRKPLGMAVLEGAIANLHLPEPKTFEVIQ